MTGDASQSLTMHHVGIDVDDLDASIAFYSRALDLETSYEFDIPEMALRGVFLTSTAGWTIELFKRDRGAKPHGRPPITTSRTTCSASAISAYRPRTSRPRSRSSWPRERPQPSSRRNRRTRTSSSRTLPIQKETSSSSLQSPRHRVDNDSCPASGDTGEGPRPTPSSLPAQTAPMASRFMRGERTAPSQRAARSGAVTETTSAGFRLGPCLRAHSNAL